MGFLGRFIRFVFWVLVVSWIVKLLGRLFSGELTGVRHRGSETGARTGPDAALGGRRLVRDPVCGMHIAEELALPLSANGETQYFCSQECRAKHESRVLRHAANA
jgi:YHS domain-containing protein